VGVGDERDVVTTHEGAVDGGAYAGVGLRAGHHQVTHPGAGQDGLQVRVLEGVAVRLVHQGLGVPAGQLGDVLPRFAALHQPLVGVLDPDERDALLAGPVDEGGDGGDDLVALVRLGDDALLDVDHEQSRVGPFSQSGHVPHAKPRH